MIKLSRNAYFTYPINCLLVLAFLFPHQLLAASLLEQNQKQTDPYYIFKTPGKTGAAFEKCNWLVDYRSRTYDLSPLVRPGLARPLEGDLRTVIRRAPMARKHLDNMKKNISSSQGHTTIATVAAVSFLLTRIFLSPDDQTELDSKTKDKTFEEIRDIQEDFRRKETIFDVLSLVSAFAFFKASYTGWQLSKDTKQELVQAIEEFNAISSDPITPKLEVN